MFVAVLVVEAAALLSSWAAWTAYNVAIKPAALPREVELSRWVTYFAWGGSVLAQVVLTASNFLFLRLLYRAIRNGRILAPQTVTRSPAWTIAWNFVPVANIIRPPGAIAQVWRASRPSGPLPRAFFLWWSAWVAYWLAAFPLVMMETLRAPAEKAFGEEAYAAVSFWLNVATVIALPLAIVFAMIVLPSLVRQQDEKIQAAAFD
jgi:uncharacterized protein DUF4328